MNGVHECHEESALKLPDPSRELACKRSQVDGRGQEVVGGYSLHPGRRGTSQL